MRSSAVDELQSRLSGFRAGIGIDDAGVVWGLNSVLVRMRKVGKRYELALDVDRERLLAMLYVAGYRPTGQLDVLRHFHAASIYWDRGEKALANFRLVFAGLPRITEAAVAHRVALAEYLLDQGCRPLYLLKELDVAVGSKPLDKYSVAQPRVPAGSGVESGQWTFWPEAHQNERPSVRPIEVAEEDEPEDKFRFWERQSLNEATAQEQLDESHAIKPPVGGGETTSSRTPGIGAGPFAGKPIPAGPGRSPSPQAQREINEEGRRYGCHECGTTDPGTSSGDFVGDHQKPTALIKPGEKQYYFPHCIDCSRSQGGRVRALKYKKDGKNE